MGTPISLKQSKSGEALNKLLLNNYQFGYLTRVLGDRHFLNMAWMHSLYPRNTFLLLRKSGSASIFYRAHIISLCQISGNAFYALSKSVPTLHHTRNRLFFLSTIHKKRSSSMYLSFLPVNSMPSYPTLRISLLFWLFSRSVLISLGHFCFGRKLVSF